MDHQLSIEAVDSTGARFANYGYFRIGEGPEYKLHVSDHTSDPTRGWLHDALSAHNEQAFAESNSCADDVPFWHRASVDPCMEASFFGQNLNNPLAEKGKGIFWRSFGGPTNSLTELKLAVRPLHPRRKISGICP